MTNSIDSNSKDRKIWLIARQAVGQMQYALVFHLFGIYLDGKLFLTKLPRHCSKLSPLHSNFKAHRWLQRGRRQHGWDDKTGSVLLLKISFNAHTDERFSALPGMITKEWRAEEGGRKSEMMMARERKPFVIFDASPHTMRKAKVGCGIFQLLSPTVHRWASYPMRFPTLSR